MPKANFRTRPRIPTQGTLKRYGLAEKEWLGILKKQGGVCAVCKLFPQSGRFVVDHQHVPKWKKMPPEERRKYVRGILCFMCNGKCVNKHMTLEKAVEIVLYLTTYHERIKRG